MSGSKPIKDLNFEQAYQVLAQSPERLFATAGAGFSPMLALAPIEQSNLKNRQEILEFGWRHQGHLIAGMFSHELGEALLGLDPRPSSYPLCELAAFGAWLEFNQEPQMVWVDEEAKNRLECALHQPMAKDRTLPSLRMDLPKNSTAHSQVIQRILSHIKAGDFYQINHCFLCHGTTNAPARDFFLKALCPEPADFTAFFEGSEYELLSLSPERFIQTQGQIIWSEPIKGTRPRGATAEEDQRLLDELKNSAKEKAELHMITDLIRNDLGRLAEIGSVVVTEPRQIRSLGQVFHGQSQIKARLKPPYSGLLALLEMLPGGSVTGCPKIRAVETIAQLEWEPRGPYTGAFAVIQPNGDLKASLLIRSLVFKGAQVSLGVGGGITIDSMPEPEWAEALAKANSVINRFER
ncbi:MAG: hypothetical protein A2508_03155 [Candidatus Lambdaproteobacteria bacterium RIFOXYD12_FULL_49_8]|nr:MAG: hypothetical protein A2508_03155 [Candidatus Lambdaproteobacteria bacterium RIFOXYD12_FULL_49_8]